MILLISLLSAALALDVRAVVVPCPLGQDTATVYEKVSSSATGGYDSDFASYSAGAQWRAYQIASCRQNLFTLYGSDMQTPIPEADQPRLRTVLEAAVAALPDPANPEVWDRYAIAAALYAAMGKGPVFLGDLWLSASWTARDVAIGYYAGLNGPVETRILLQGGWEELKKPLSNEDRKKVLFNLVRVAYRGGYVSERDGFLAAFEAVGSLTQAEVEAVARVKKMSQIEASLQEKALAAYQQARADASTPKDERIRITYLCADLLRRLGQEQAALPLYTEVSNDTNAPADLRKFALALAGPIMAQQ